MKRLIAVGFVLSILFGMVSATASTPGSSANPLISRSYLEGAFNTSVRNEATNILRVGASTAMGRLDEIYRDYGGYDFAQRFTAVWITSGGTILLPAGSSFTLLSGTATLTIIFGAVVNISTGSVMASGTRLAPNQRYFSVENTLAEIAAGSSITGYVDGYYNIDNGGFVVTHPVFSDVMEHQWYYPAVDFVQKEQLFVGTAPNTFSPNAPMTRGMFVTVLHRLDGLPSTTSGNSFSDVNDPGTFFYDAVTWASRNNIVTGFPDGRFRPNALVTREQMAAIMYRYAGYKKYDLSAPTNALDSFPDRGEVAGFAAREMRWAVARGVIGGSGGRLMPKETATRAQVAQIILNYCDYTGTIN